MVGYAYATRHRERASYRWATDVTVYVAPQRHRRGVGRALYETLFGLLAEQGFRIACAGITLPNEASVGLHEALGFEPVGVYRRIGFKLGRLARRRLVAARARRSGRWTASRARSCRPAERLTSVLVE